MKRIAWLTLIAAMLLVSAASAAYVSISAPKEVYVGDRLVVAGTSVAGEFAQPSLKPGFSTDVILYYAKGTKSEVARKTIVVQENGLFSATFDTAGLAAGTYSIEIVDPTQTTFGGSSKVQQMVELIDRSKDIVVDSPLTQEFDGTLDLRGTVSGIGDAGVQVRVEHDAAVIYGPKYIRTDANGAFSEEVPIPDGGTYGVTFSDTKGFISTVTFVISGKPAPTSTPAMISANAPATRSAPAYFEVDTKSGTVTITTSVGIDWVIEYIDEDGGSHKVNDKGQLEPETAEFVARGGTVYVKVYPMSYSDRGTVQVSAANADSIRVSQAASGLFGDAVPTTAQATPLPAFLALLALIVVVVLARRG